MTEKTEIQRSADSEAFALAQREAGAWSSSSLVPQAYQGNIPNVLIAMEMAKRIGASVMAVMQNLHIIHGKPAFGASFLIATVNGSGRFTPIRYRMEGDEGDGTWGCRAYATDRESGDECVGPVVTIGIAKAEGWLGKNGSKWKTMPELMLHYRAAAFWTRVYCPELSMGIHTTEEMEDVRDVQAAKVEVVKPLDKPWDSRAAGMERIEMICAEIAGDHADEFFQNATADLGLPLTTDEMDSNQFNTIVAELESRWKQTDDVPDMTPTPVDVAVTERDLYAELSRLAKVKWGADWFDDLEKFCDGLKIDFAKASNDDLTRAIGILSGQPKEVK